MAIWFDSEKGIFFLFVDIVLPTLDSTKIFLNFVKYFKESVFFCCHLIVRCFFILIIDELHLLDATIPTNYY